MKNNKNKTNNANSTNAEKYKQAFSALHTSRDFNLEVQKMGNIRTKANKLVASIAVVVFVLGGATVAYAADVGGIQSIVELWFRGEQRETTIDFDGNGNYELEYTDEDGNIHNIGGGGVALEDNGVERPLTEEELMETMNSPEVEFLEDGTVFVYWYDQTIDITDKFEDGVCYIKLEHGNEEMYMTVTENGYSASSDGFVEP